MAKVKYIGPIDEVEVELPADKAAPDASPRHARVKRMGVLNTTAEHAKQLKLSDHWEAVKATAAKPKTAKRRPATAPTTAATAPATSGEGEGGNGTTTPGGDAE